MLVLNEGTTMPVYRPSNSPEQNLALLAENEYPGRLIIVGFAGDLAVQAYAVMGRSDGSRNRVLRKEDGIVYTEPADKTKGVGDPELTVYDAMRRSGDTHVVSNGAHTDTILRFLRCGKTFGEAIQTLEHEPDSPNFTPRIAGYTAFGQRDEWLSYGLAVVSRDGNGESVPRVYTSRDAELDSGWHGSGIGFAVHTYAHNVPDGEPLPSFDEAPFAVPTHANPADMVEMVWESLNPEFRVAAAAKVIHFSGRVTAVSIANRHVID